MQVPLLCRLELRRPLYLLLVHFVHDAHGDLDHEWDAQRRGEANAFAHEHGGNHLVEWNLPIEAENVPQQQRNHAQ